MVRGILQIGTGRYKFNGRKFAALMEESRNQAAQAGHGPGTDAGRADGPVEEQWQDIFDEVMTLFHEYMRNESIDVLIQLKCKLEEASIRYHSHLLAEEVININSYLPYERRVPRQ